MKHLTAQRIEERIAFYFFRCLAVKRTRKRIGVQLNVLSYGLPRPRKKIIVRLLKSNVNGVGPIGHFGGSGFAYREIKLITGISH